MEETATSLSLQAVLFTAALRVFLVASEHSACEDRAVGDMRRRWLVGHVDYDPPDRWRYIDH